MEPFVGASVSQMRMPEDDIWTAVVGERPLRGALRPVLALAVDRM
jgi:hypothetical protein